MTDIAVRAVNLSKKYRIAGTQARYRTIRETLVNTAAAPVRRAADILRGRAPSANGHDEIWALKDVSFEIRRGEVVGIIGPNGAGKSTLLKILSRITRPTEGYADIYGRVGSLLEVGTGFHPELSGRENVYLSGAVLGMQRGEIERKFDEIVDFAGVEKFVDTPVKHFSSGMYLRLAFSVAAHLEPEILLVDEVLAVGDATFQKKCLGKMGDVAQEGRTVLFVSHNMVAVRNLCQRVVRLESGKIIDDGAPYAVVHSYLDSIGDDGGQGERTWEELAVAPGNDIVRLRRVYAKSSDREAQNPYTDQQIELGVEFWSMLPDSALVVTLLVVSSDGSIAFTTSTAHSPGLVESHLQPGLYKSWCHIPPNLLNSNLYRIHVLFVRNQTQVVFKLEDALTLEVLDAASWRRAYHGRRPGVVAPILPWNMEQLAELSEAV